MMSLFILEENFMIRTASRIALTLAATTLFACGSSSLHETESFGRVAPASGSVSLTNAAQGDTLSGLVFENEGTGNIEISALVTTLASGEVITSQGGFGVEAGESVTYIFDSAEPQSVASISFTVGGSTETLEVFATQESGHVP